MIKELVKLANHLDSKGFVKEADYLDEIVNFSKEESEDETLENSDVERPIIFEAIIDRSLVIRTAVKVDDDQAADIRDDFATLLSDVDMAHMSGESFRVDYEDAVVSLPSGQVYRLHWEEMPSGRGIRSIFSNVDMVVPMIGDRADGNVDVDALSEAGIFHSLELSAVDKYKDVIDIRTGRKMIKDLIKLANHLDSKGFVKEADYLDGRVNLFAKPGFKKSSSIDDLKELVKISNKLDSLGLVQEADELDKTIYKLYGDDDHMSEEELESIDDRALSKHLGQIGQKGEGERRHLISSDLPSKLMGALKQFKTAFYMFIRKNKDSNFDSIENLTSKLIRKSGLFFDGDEHGDEISNSGNSLDEAIGEYALSISNYNKYGDRAPLPRLSHSPLGIAKKEISLLSEELARAIKKERRNHPRQKLVDSYNFGEISQSELDRLFDRLPRSQQEEELPLERHTGISELKYAMDNLYFLAKESHDQIIEAYSSGSAAREGFERVVMDRADKDLAVEETSPQDIFENQMVPIGSPGVDFFPHDYEPYEEHQDEWYEKDEWYD